MDYSTTVTFSHVRVPIQSGPKWRAFKCELWLQEGTGGMFAWHNTVVPNPDNPIFWTRVAGTVDCSRYFRTMAESKFGGVCL